MVARDDRGIVRDDLPSGTVTFLFTDVEGSTRLLRELGAERYAATLDGHRRVIRDACAEHGGVEVDTQGDAFFFAFPTAPGGLAAAEALTERLSVQSPIRVRVGVHTGTPLLTGEGYVGDDVHRAARIAAAGHGGQVLVSAATAALTECHLRDLGEHRLKDLTAPQRLFQLGAGDQPPPRSLRLTNLPIPVTPFVGRERELSEVVEAVCRDDVRLLTLTGPGGTGKTRLAAQAAGLAADAFPDGIWWVPLSTLHDPALVLPAAAQTLGARDELQHHIGDRQLLVLFDNFEHLVQAAGSLGRLLTSCPNLTLLVTSREPLHLGGEREYAVQPLGRDDAVELFLARGRAVDPGLASDAAVREICRRLDDLPLALELAAARVKALTPAQLLGRLDRSLPLLTGGARDAPERQRTLRATIEWSYELLSPDEQGLFARLSVFAGGCTLEAAEQVAAAELDTLQSLVDKSLVRFAAERYWMLETIREYAASLAQTDDELRNRHLAFFLDLVTEAEPHLTGRDQQQWFERLAREQGNVREALRYACHSGDAERALMLAGTFWRFWWTRGPIDEMELWYERAFAVEGETSDLARARGLFGAAHAAELRADVEGTRTLFTDAAELLRRLGETRWLILALSHLGGAYADDLGRAEQIQLEAIELADETQDVRGGAVARGNLATQLMETAEPERVVELLEAALMGHRQLGDAYGTATVLQVLASLALTSGATEQAAANLVESLELSRAIGDRLNMAGSLSIAAGVVLARGESSDAARLLGASDAHAKEFGVDPSVVWETPISRIRDEVEAALGDRFEDERRAGGELDLEDAVELSLGAIG